MRITMVKKRLANGDPCQKCAQTEEMLKRRGHWGAIDEVVWAVEGEPDAPGWGFAARHGVDVAPFFVIEVDGEETVITSPLRLIKTWLEAPKASADARPVDEAEVAAWARELADAEPERILAAGLDRFGDRLAIAFSGGLDVVLLDMASRIGRPFRVFTLDTGRLHQETYAYMDDVRRRYGVELEVFLPDSAEAMEMMSRSGVNSFLRDGHARCCEVRQVRPLARALAARSAWVTGRMAEPGTSSDAPIAEVDPRPTLAHAGLVRIDPLARWSRDRTLEYARAHDVPLNPLLEQGYSVIGCAPCTRAVGPDEARTVRWWWEEGGGSELVVQGDGI